jgi:Fe(3+) dicitrate transport protein
VAGIAAVLASSAALAQGAAPPPRDLELEFIEPTVVVIGDRIRLDRIPGSATIIDQDLLRDARVFNINEALRKVPGVYAREEEGFGLRPNIGIRGLNPTRSSKVLLLEDGIPLTYAPYGDNATYYHPPVDRFERIEVLKGSGQILFGPQTIGGVINYLTPSPPTELSTRIATAIGNEGYFEAHGEIGDTLGNTGVLLHGTWKEGDGARENLNFEVADLNLKVVQRISDRQALTLRGNFYDESSQVTYSGLTLAEFKADPRQNPFANDHMYARRWGLSATHGFEFSEAVSFTTNAYYAWFNRDWWRQSSNSGQRPNDASDPLCGGMANLNTSCGNEGRIRQFWTAGVEPRVSITHALFGLDNLAEAGARYHHEDQYRVQANGDTPRARRPGTGRNAGIREDSDREIDALSAFVQNRFDFGRFALTPGLRYEHVDYERVDNLLGTRGDATVEEWIPGLGATFDLVPGTVLFAGAHRGFAPPGVADIVTAQGGTVDLDAELSWNYELGLRSELRTGVYAEATLFRMDFENQIVPQSVAGGSGAALTSAGETLHQGLELLGQVESDAFVEWPVNLYTRVAYTWLKDAKYEGQRFSSVSGFTNVSVEGNRLPYAPEHLLSAALGGRTGFGLDVQLEAVHTSAAYTDDLNTRTVVANGQRGEMDGHTVWNLTANYTLDLCDCKLYVAAKNLTDELYVVDMSRGLTVGMPRLVQGGFELKF